MDCFNCPNQWKCEVMDAVLQDKKSCPKTETKVTDTTLQSKVWSNGGYLYKAIADTLKERRMI